MIKIIRVRSWEPFETILSSKNRAFLEETHNVTIISRGSSIRITGNADNVATVQQILKGAQLRFGMDAGEPDLPFNDGKPEIYLANALEVLIKNKKVIPRSKGQLRYITNIQANDVCFGIGPAGTGKTYLAMACAVNYLKNHTLSRIILVRPAVEAGENLGYLPGDLYEKILPYLRPLYDALYDMVDPEMVRRYLDKNTIEVVPLAYMRGRTLNNSFIILDEAQNTTIEQMKMFLTRLGFNSKMVITGDITQVDLPENKICGLIAAKDILKNIKGISFTTFTRQDVVRHALVKKIILAFEKDTKNS